MRIIDDITRFIFVSDTPQKSDIIFIPGGSNPEPSETAAALWLQGYAPLLMPSGLFNTKLGYFPGPKSKATLYDGKYASEAAFMQDVLVKSGVAENAICIEDRAGERGTVDNAFFSKDLITAMGLTINHAIICCKSFHARRCLLSYTWAFPQTVFYMCPTDIQFRGKEDWFLHDEGIKTVMSELQKCGQYFADKIPLFTTAK